MLRACVPEQTHFAAWVRCILTCLLYSWTGRPPVYTKPWRTRHRKKKKHPCIPCRWLLCKAQLNWQRHSTLRTFSAARDTLFRFLSPITSNYCPTRFFSRMRMALHWSFLHKQERRVFLKLRFKRLWRLRPHAYWESNSVCEQNR